MKPAPSVQHRAALATRPVPRLRSATQGLRQVARRVSILEPAAPRSMGCLQRSFHLAPPPGSALLNCPDDGLAAFVNMDVFHSDLLLGRLALQLCHRLKLF